MILFLHLLHRELADRRYFFAAALAIGFLPYLVALFARASPEELPDVRAGIARAILLGFLAGVPLVLGARWLIADFATGRRAFELARPVSAGVLCGSKLATHALMIFGGALLTTLPTKMSALSSELPLFANLVQNPEFPFRSLILVAPLVALGVWAAFTAAQTFSLLLADRGRLSLADLFTSILCIALLAFAYRRCVFFDAPTIAFSWLGRLGLGLAALGAFAAWRSIQAGSLVERAHRRHSQAMIPGLLAIGCLTALVAAWILRPDVDKLMRFTLAVPNVDGSRWLIAGEQDWRGFEPMFEADPATRKATYLAPRSRIDGFPWLSADGRRIGHFREAAGTVKIHQLADGEVQGSSTVRWQDPYGTFAEVDDRLELAISSAAPGNLQAFSLESPGQRLAHVESEELRGQLVLILHRTGSVFDIVVHRPDEEKGEARTWTLSHFAFEAKSGELRRGESWTCAPGKCQPRILGDPDWWREALPLLEKGVGFSRLARQHQISVLEGGFGAMPAAVVQEAYDVRARIRPREWILFDAANERLGSFDAPPDFRPAGEIRPGLLLVGGAPAKIEIYPHLRDFVSLQTLVVEVPSGRILRTLDGFTPIRHSRRVWLVDRSGAPYDLESADAEPRPILPWLPRAAAQPADLRLAGG